VSEAFEGQIAVVTGGTRGIGGAVTSALLGAGAAVRAIYRSDEAAARAFADEHAPHAPRLSVHRVDVADSAAVDAFWRETEEAASAGVQILVNNAGIRRDAIVGMMSAEDWRAVLDTNLTGSFLMSKLAVRSMMRGRYGRIVFVTSPSGGHGFAGQGNYAASKAGQVGLMRALAREVARKGITANCVSPGFVDTDLVADLPEEKKKEYLSMVPVGRFGRPAEIAWAVLALCSREASYVNGAVLEVTGGI
jgi:3-oxoacyl-[acyl-carrier protein] reductase